ncbi:MAG: glycerol-3-phosphate 1-O-acyltransferase PlsY [Alphaproteobacteria bacterium]
MPAIDWGTAWPLVLAAVVFGYLLGSIPFGLILTRMAGLGDIRKVGSGNIGATNVLRTGNKGLAALTLVLDAAKGAAAVLIARAYHSPDLAAIAALGALFGHLFPVWLKFNGGKGVATALGILLAAAWPVGLAACATWLLTALAFRFSSLAALIAMAMAPVYAWFLDTPLTASLAALIAVIVWLTHHANIARLVAGQEPKIGRTKNPPH